MSVRLSEWNNPSATGRDFMEFGIWGIFWKSVEKKLKFHWNRTRTKGTLREDQNTFFITSRLFLHRMRNVSDKSCRENQNTHFVFSKFFPRKSCLLWESVEKYCRAGEAIDDNMAHADATNTHTHSGCVTLIALPLRLYERAWELRYTYIACLVVVYKYRVIHKSLQDFRTRLRNNQDRHGRKEHINR